MSISVRSWDDPASWNEFLATIPSAHFQQTWEWGELGPQLGSKVVRLAALCNDRIVGTMQVFINPIGPTRWTHLYVPRGPVMAQPRLQTLGPLVDAARDIGQQHGALGIKIESNAPACDRAWSTALESMGFAPTHPPTQPRSSWLLDLTEDEDAILARMKQKTRYNARLAARRGVSVHEGTAKDIDAFYDLYVDTAQRDGFFIHAIEVYRRMFDLFWRSESFSLLLARAAGELVGAVTLVRLGNTCWYLQGASSTRHRNLMATYLLQWEGIRRAKQMGCALYDFRAVPDILAEDQDMYGVYRFKEGFGGYHFTTLPTFACPYRPGLFGLWQSFVAGRFALDGQRRRRAGLPARQFA
jgi:peptidoglycan pentaglycine glycine transferase (the first glycine)